MQARVLCRGQTNFFFVYSLLHFFSFLSHLARHSQSSLWFLSHFISSLSFTSQLFPDLPRVYLVPFAHRFRASLKCFSFRAQFTQNDLRASLNVFSRAVISFELLRRWVCKLKLITKRKFFFVFRDVERELFPCLRRLGMAFYAYNPVSIFPAFFDPPNLDILFQLHDY